jgi:hypothetical protein
MQQPAGHDSFLGIQAHRCPAAVEHIRPAAEARAVREELYRVLWEWVASLTCPSCGLEYTPAAAEWAMAWREGRRDLLLQQGCLDGERDGATKVRCELCGKRGWLSPFGGRVVEPDAEPSDAADGGA